MVKPLILPYLDILHNVGMYGSLPYKHVSRRNASLITPFQGIGQPFHYLETVMISPILIPYMLLIIRTVVTACISGIFI